MCRKALRTFVPLATVVVAACSQDRPTAPLAAESSGPTFAAAGAERIPGQYIVRLRDDVSDVGGIAALLASAHGGAVERIYTRAIKGFSLRLPDAAAAVLARHPLVQYIEQDARAQLFVTTQSNPPSWGTDRVDQNDLPLDQQYSYFVTGAGTNVYIFDTGVRLTHVDFGGRAAYVPGGTNGDFVGDGVANAADCHGHGTHVAGTAAGTTYGLAKGAKIWAARVVNCQGSGNASMLIAALDWCVTGCVKPAVVNMSLGYGNTQSVRDATKRVYAAGINTVSAAGNGNWFGTPMNACNEAPAGEPTTNTVGATTSTDNESSFSNYGTCVDILAPGSSIVSASHSSDNGSTTMSGTSMATPQVVGAIAMYLQTNPSATPAQASSAVEANAISNTITLHSSSKNNGTPNLFLNTHWIGNDGSAPPPPPPPPTNNPPVAKYTWSCGGSGISGRECRFDGSTSNDGEGGKVTSYYWDFKNGGATSTLEKPTHKFTTSGTYSVLLRVTDAQGATDTAQCNVTTGRNRSGSCQ